MYQDSLQRCSWSGGSDAYRAYHDEEWGVPQHNDRDLFEFILLEGAQAGLSWSTILNKRAGYRRLFADFDPQQVAQFDAEKIALLLQDAAIVRNRAKVNAAVGNALAFLEVQSEYGSFDSYIWQFVDGEPLQNAWQSMADVPATTAQSDAMSKDLKRRGFKFVGSTICYAFMQATGMVNDHTVECFRHAECLRLAPAMRSS
jgi:DNA-3-methyladenine glycosylase I